MSKFLKKTLVPKSGYELVNDLQYDIAKGQSGLVVCLETCLPRVLKHPVG
jgi:hypothetical protein